MTKTQRTITERALRKIKKCDGNCKSCRNLLIPSQKNVYAFMCGIADKAGYTPMSNHISDVKNEAIECLEIEIA